MKKIKYFCCLLGLVLTGLACQDDDETTVIPKPEGITYGTVTDKGGNIYKTLTIGNQTWLAENFRYRPKEAILFLYKKKPRFHVAPLNRKGFIFSGNTYIPI